MAVRLLQLPGNLLRTRLRQSHLHQPWTMQQQQLILREAEAVLARFCQRPPRGFEKFFNKDKRPPKSSSSSPEVKEPDNGGSKKPSSPSSSSPAADSSPPAPPKIKSKPGSQKGPKEFFQVRSVVVHQAVTRVTISDDDR